MMDDATLLSLPVEVRLHIYSYLFKNEWTYINPCRENSLLQQQRHPRPCIAPLLYTCRQIREEASQIYFSNLKVFLDIQTFNSNGLREWLQHIGDANARQLRHVNVRWNNYVDVSIDLSRQQGFHSTANADLRIQRQHGHDDGHQCLAQMPTRKARGLHFRHRSTRPPRVAPPQAPVPAPDALSLRSLHNTTNRELFTWLSYQTTNDILTKSLKQLCFHRPVTRLPTSTKSGAKHKLTIKAVPIPGLNFANDYWDINGTEKFCEALSQHLSMRLDELLIRRDGQSLTASEILGMVDEIDEHASALRWLWYW